MLQLATIIGARPQFIKSAAVSRAVQQHYNTAIREIIIHTGQHYDELMSQVFFDELELKQPDIRLECGPGLQGAQTARMLEELEKVLLEIKPDAVLVYGDTNSTLAGALAASKLQLPVIHVEAGLRSWNKSMPEEINRVLCDHVSALLFAPTAAGFDNLRKEGIGTDTASSIQQQLPAVFHSGDVMYDNAMHYATRAAASSDVLRRNGLEPGAYFLATIHRNYNTDSPQRLRTLLEGIEMAAAQFSRPVILPLHPRTAQRIATDPELGKLVKELTCLRIIPPVSFLDMLLLEQAAQLIFTDSGGVQKEAFFFHRPCVILRPETEWVELVDCGAARLADASPHHITEATAALLRNAIEYPAFYGDGHAAEFICSKIIELIKPVSA
jgi:UDP-GlcNAc3NAcA epimerase